MRRPVCAAGGAGRPGAARLAGHRAEQRLERRLELLADRAAWCAGPSASAGSARAARWVEKPTASRKSAGSDAAGPVRPRVSPNASTALMPAARDQVLGHRLHQHPAQPAAAVLRVDVGRSSACTASALTGAVAKPSAAGHVHRRAPRSGGPPTSPSTHSDPAARAPLAQHHRDPGGLLLGLVATHRVAAYGIELPEHARRRTRRAARRGGPASAARSCVPRAHRRRRRRIAMPDVPTIGPSGARSVRYRDYRRRQRWVARKSAIRPIASVSIVHVGQRDQPEVVGLEPVEAGAVGDQDLLGAQQVDDELLVVLDRVDRRGPAAGSSRARRAARRS